MFVSQALTPRVTERNKAQRYYFESKFWPYTRVRAKFKSITCQFNLLKFEIPMTLNDLFSDCMTFDDHIIEKMHVLYSVLIYNIQFIK